MLILGLIIACILLLVTYLVVTVRRHDRQAHADRERDPFYSELERLAAAGLLYEEAERRTGRPRHSYVVTPAGEAALRTWLREPMNDPGLLRLYFAGVVGPADVVALAREERGRHERDLERFDRVEEALGRKQGWDDTRDLIELCREFSGFCRDWWGKKADEPMNAVGRDGEDPRADGKPPKDEQAPADDKKEDEE